jgi:hypothetical protein
MIDKRELMFPSSKPTRVASQKIEIARRVVTQLRRRLRKDLLAAGVTGSIARGTAETYSDVDLVIMVKKVRHDLPNLRVIHGTYCSIGQQTFNDALSKLSQPCDELSEILGGYSQILPIYDPLRLFPKLEKRAVSVPGKVFRESARIALLHSYEDFCRAKNAFLKGDHIVLMDNILQITYSAALVVASLNHAAFVSDREIFKAHKRFSKLPRRFERIEKLRYGNLKGRRLLTMLMDFYLDLIRFCEGENLHFPVDERTLKGLNSRGIDHQYIEEESAVVRA